MASNPTYPEPHSKSEATRLAIQRGEPAPTYELTQMETLTLLENVNWAIGWLEGSRGSERARHRLQDAVNLLRAKIEAKDV